MPDHTFNSNHDADHDPMLNPDLTSSDLPADDDLARHLAAMKEQMVPSPELVNELTARIKAAPPTDDAMTAHANPPVTPDDPSAHTGPSAHVVGADSVRTALTADRPSARPTATPHQGRGPRSTSSGKAKRRRLTPALFGGVTATALAAVMVIGGLPVFENSEPPTGWPPPAEIYDPLSDVPGDGGQPVAPSNYSEIWELLYPASSGDNVQPGGIVYGSTPTSGDAPVVSASGADVASVAGVDMSGSDSSGTNTQVAGVDEGDIVKTDGSYLYAAHGRRVSVITASGADTHEVAVIDVSGLVAEDEVATGPIVDLMIDGTTLIIFTHGFTAEGFDDWTRHAGSWMSLEASTLKAAYYSIADPANPTLLTTISQSGTYNNSRMSDGVLYLVSDYPLSPSDADPEDPATFVPSVGVDADSTVLAPDDVHILPIWDFYGYTVVTATHVADGQLLDQESVLGRADTIYMSAENLYLATTNWNYAAYADDAEGLTLPGADRAYVGPTTTLARLGLNGGAMEMAAQTEIPGTLLNQFSMDEYEGHLRVVTTRDSDTNEARPWVQIPGLWVLDGSLTVVGSIPQLVSDEEVKSVRFDQGIGYVVTFRQIDPLFTLDLTNPTAPVVQGELKIPGFSSYLHPFGEGLLLGIGVDTGASEVGTPDTGALGDLGKLSMFDVSDPFNVTELAVTTANVDTWAVAEDHKAAWVDVERGLIGFPSVILDYDAVEEFGYYIPTWTYEVFSWDGAAFQPLATLNLGDGIDWAKASGTAYDFTTRGIRISDALYVTSAHSIGVYEITDYTKIAAVEY